MSIKMTNAEAMNGLTVLGQIKETGKLGFAIAKNVRKLQEELKEYLEKRDGLIRKYGHKTEDGQYMVENEQVADFLKELREYDTIEFSFNPQMVNEDVFCSGSLTSDQMYVLDWMVQDS